MGFMGQFAHTICSSSHSYHTETSWPFISKVGHLGATLVHKLNNAKTDKFEFFFTIVTKHINTWVLWVNWLTLYVVHLIRITQKPHDHLFQKVGAYGRNFVAQLKQAKIDKFGLFLYDCNQIQYQIRFTG